MANKLQSKLGIYLNPITVDREFWTLGLTVVTIGPTAGEYAQMDRYPIRADVRPETIRNAGSELIGGLYLDNLRIGCQGDTRESGRANGAYGFTVRYQDVYAIDRQDHTS